MYQTKYCEVCEKLPDRICASLDQPAEAYCEEHYWEHVRLAHHGRELAGSAVIRREKEHA